jgi:hypothetical protein
MAGSIADFKASFNKDVARSNKFDVLINTPLSLITAVPMTRKKLSYRCEVSQLPGRTFATMDRKTYGPVEKLPYLTTYNDIDLTFIVDDDMATKYLFDAWLDLVNPKQTNNFNYRNTYATSVFINQYDVANEKTYSVELIDAYPISINQMDLDWSSDSIHKLTVTFAYTKWINDSIMNYIF